MPRGKEVEKSKNHLKAAGLISRNAITISSCKRKIIWNETTVKPMTKGRGRYWQRIVDHRRWSPELSGRTSTATAMEPPCLQRPPLQHGWFRPCRRRPFPSHQRSRSSYQRWGLAGSGCRSWFDMKNSGRGNWKFIGRFALF